MRSKLKVLTSYSIVCKGGIIHYKTFGSAWSVLCFVVLHLKTTLCLFTLPLFPGTFLLRPTFLNLFDLPVFFEETGIHANENPSYCSKHNGSYAAIKGSAYASNKQNGNKENNTYQ